MRHAIAIEIYVSSNTSRSRGDASAASRETSLMAGCAHRASTGYPQPGGRCSQRIHNSDTDQKGDDFVGFSAGAAHRLT
jgi:hypothetical protein